MQIGRTFNRIDEIEGVLLIDRFDDGDDGPKMVKEVVSKYLKLAPSLTE